MTQQETADFGHIALLQITVSAITVILISLEHQSLAVKLLKSIVDVHNISVRFFDKSRLKCNNSVSENDNRIIMYISV